jgi:beta-xylosidase
MSALDDFEVTVTLCFTPEHRGLQPHHTSPPQAAQEYAEFCARMVRRYAPGANADRQGSATVRGRALQLS